MGVPEQSMNGAPPYAPASGAPNGYQATSPVPLAHPIASAPGYYVQQTYVPGAILQAPTNAAGTSVAVVTVPAYVIPSQAALWGPRPQQCLCAHCGKVVVTNVTHKTGTTTWLASLAFCAFGCVLGCCLIPFFTKSLKDVDHQCSSCGALLGTYQR